MHSKCKTVQPLVLWVTKVVVTCVRLQTQPKTFQKINSRTKNNFLVYGENTYHTISIYGKMLIIEFSYNFLYVWNCMKLYEKKFPIYQNCMKSIFGQPGQWNEQLHPTHACASNSHLHNIKISKTSSSYAYRRNFSDGFLPINWNHTMAFKRILFNIHCVWTKNKSF